MKKVLIISYFFPPCNLTASQRVMGWANYLSGFGYYPIIVTRNWDIAINSPEDASLSTGIDIKHEKNDRFEVYYLPFVANRRDNIYANNKHNRYLQKLSKVITFTELIFENYFNSAIPSINLYEFSRRLISENKSIVGLIISAKPFIHFKFGYCLNKEFNIKWIADYRDDWNTSELEANKSFLLRTISIIQARKEKKWVSTSQFITSISGVYADRVGRFVRKEGVVILNGYDGIDGAKIGKEIESDSFQITYNGSLYSTQPIEIILEKFKNICDNPDVKIRVQFNFPGLGFDKGQEKRVKNCLIGYENFIRITDRIPHQDILEIQRNSDVLLMVSHKGFKGVSSSKLYEYVGLKKSILLYPNDNDIVAETITDTGLGIICDSEIEFHDNLLQLIFNKQDGKIEVNSVENDKVEFYSRKNQAKELAKLLDRMTKIKDK